MTKLVGFLATVLGLSALAQTARADCARGAYYEVTVTDSTVQICPGATKRTCGESTKMLRQNVDTGEVVELADFCVTSGFDASCYQDECVPAGTYRYGFATVFSCDEAGCGAVEYWGEAIVDVGATGACTWSSGNTAPTAYSAETPWSSTTDGAKSCPSSCLCTATHPMALFTILVPLAIRLRRLRRLR
jgi:hypothetical protein